MTAANPTYTVFAVAPKDQRTPEGFSLTRYHVDEVRTFRGTPTAMPAVGDSLIRLDGPTPPPLNVPLTYRGVTGHLEYTSAAQVARLSEAKAEYPGSPDTVAVLIPIRKTAAWWNLPQDRRQSHFTPSTAHAGHTAIGEPYVDRVFRRLYHSRYQGEHPVDYDFLTYFEFEKADAPRFRELLGKLRDNAVNPEWAYVDLEFEVWMTKLA